MIRAPLPLEDARMLTTRTFDRNPLDVLRVALPLGNVLEPDHAEWDAARGGYDTAADLRPAAIVEARGLADIQTAMMFARAQGYGIAPQSTGHGAAALASLQDTILLRTTDLSGVEIDPVARVARVYPGTTWGELAAAAGEHGLAGLAGTHDSVGVVGFTLGGGLGRLGRAHGLACNSVRAIELFTTDGRFVRTDAEHEPELFWALRGGGVGAGVVTALELELYPVPEVYAGLMVWSAERALEVLRTWRTWTAHVPRTVASTAMLTTLPSWDVIPEALRGRLGVVLEVAHHGDQGEAHELLEPLRALQPRMDTVAAMPTSALGRLLDGGANPAPGAKAHDHVLLDALPDAAIEALLHVAGPRADSPLVFLELRHLGGALGVAPPGAGALARLDGAYSLHAAGLRGPEVTSRLNLLMWAMAPWSRGRVYLNFAHGPGARGRAFDGDVHERLASVKAAYDRHGLVRVRHAG
jgi:FAD/FMN-containing dehydrogenase